MSKEYADKMRQSVAYSHATMKCEPYDWVDVVRWKLAESYISPMVMRDIEELSVEMRKKFPSHEGIVWDDHMATNWTGGSEGGSMCDPEDFMINVIDMADRLRERGAVGTLFADALEACFEDCGEIIAADMDELEQANKRYEE